ncbi:MAG: T9SS type A sorting domain-containing protein [Candidatus Marinamargulisbacteria bacterium]
MKQGLIKLIIFMAMQLMITGVQASVEIKGRVLNAPNPFKFSQGTTLVYNLTHAADVQLVMYDVRGQMILNRSFSAGSNGGNSNRNQVVISQHDFNGFGLSNGVYFYVLITNGKVLGKGKMAVI